MRKVVTPCSQTLPEHAVTANIVHAIVPSKDTASITQARELYCVAGIRARPAGRFALDLVSLHVPKAMGTSMRLALETIYGRDKVAIDYNTFLDADEECHDLLHIPETARVVHGHFPARRYERLPADVRVTFLREPVDRMISHYYFWRRHVRHHHPVHDRMVAEQWSPETFAAYPAVRYFYSRTIFGGADMGRFDLIGAVARVERDWPRLLDLIGKTGSLPRENINTAPCYAAERDALVNDSRRIARLRDLLAADIAFYEKFTA